MKRVAIYARFSSDMQRTESITAQTRACKVACSQKGYEIVKVYPDEAKSGKNDKREQFQQMISDSSLGIFDIVMVHKLDRFSRDPADTMTYDKILKNNGVELLSVSESFDNTPEGAMMKAVIVGMNQYYILNLAREVKKGQKENAYQCLSNGGKALGYDVVDKKYVLNLHEAEAVKLIFSMYDEGCGYFPIITKLNALGYKTKAGKEFGRNSIYGILRNEKYIGNYLYNKIPSPNSKGRRNSHATKDEKDLIRVEGGVPAIVDKSLWERAQKRLDSNSLRGGSFKAKNTYLLSGIIYCGECGKSMHGNARKPAQDREQYISYRCNSRCNKGNFVCSNKEVQRDKVEEYVLNQLSLYMFNDTIIPKLTQKLNDYISASSITNTTEKKLYETKLSELKKSKDNIIQAIATSGFQDVFAPKLQELEANITSINSKLIEISSSPTSVTVTEAMVRNYFSKFSDFVKHRDYPEIKRIINNYVDRVDVYKDKITVTFKVAFDFDNCANGELKYTFDTTVERANLVA